MSDDPACGRTMDGETGEAEPIAARTYCGPLHGRHWTLTQTGPPSSLDLPDGPRTLHYRLVFDQRNGRPARDDYGCYVYVQAR